MSSGAPAVTAAGRFVLARAPNHLGDGVMALPAMHALAARAGRLLIQAPGWGPALYRDVAAEISPRGPAPAGVDVAVLFPPSFRAAWAARRAKRRVGTPTDGRWPLLTDRVAERVHRASTYAALVEAVGAVAAGPPRFPAWASDPEADVPEGHIGLNPISPSGETVTWRGYAELAAALGRPVVFYAGPGEGDALAAVAGDHERRVGLPLPAFAAALRRCPVFVSNDSGAAHFARACGTPTVVVHGSTTARRTGAAGALAVEGPNLPCRPCYRKTCPFPAIPCLDVPVAAVLAAIVAAEAACAG